MPALHLFKASMCFDEQALWRASQVIMDKSTMCSRRLMGRFCSLKGICCLQIVLHGSSVKYARLIIRKYITLYNCVNSEHACGGHVDGLKICSSYIWCQKWMHCQAYCETAQVKMSVWFIYDCLVFMCLQRLLMCSTELVTFNQLLAGISKLKLKIFITVICFYLSPGVPASKEVVVQQCDLRPFHHD